MRRGHDFPDREMMRMSVGKTLALCLIAKNEENDIERCIRSVRGIVDEIVVVDTGSTDRTVEIAQRCGAAVFHYEWNDDFSAARNFAIGCCTGDWLLLLDADEALFAEDAEKLRALIDRTDKDGFHLIIHNYTGKTAGGDYVTHVGLRLVRNNHRYHYAGEIHEQVVRRDGRPVGDAFSQTDIRVHHYGYLESEVRSKNKRQRNIPILEKQLKNHPDNAFTLFNMGNEYMAMNDFRRALDYYRRADGHADFRASYGLHLLFRMANCYSCIGQFGQALRCVARAQALYPACTDLEFIKGGALMASRRYTLAIDSFEKCLRMGEPPAAQRFFDGCGTYRAARALADLYMQLEDYPRALFNYSRTLQLNGQSVGVLYRIGHALNRMLDDKDEVYRRLTGYFATPDYPSNVIMTADILIGEGLASQAERCMASVPAGGEYAVDILFLSAKTAYRTHDYPAAAENFSRLAEGETDGRILPDIRPESARYLFAVRLITGEGDLPQAVGLIGRYGGDCERRVCAQFAASARRTGGHYLDGSEPDDELRAAVLPMLDRVLKAGEYDTFEKMLPVFRFFSSRTALLDLACLYYDNGYRDMATRSILRSVRELDAIDSRSASILARELQ